ncbi:MFS transporter [Geomonas paludis]|uniref:MFS transporter n=1 Tax=Geomonas paludis TaxID=2740185 RepID=A0A6V8MS10_9BACT|nr:MFS transporter [Geomonas paludis]UPU35519.1 MFS transporter [Geomonas paludis]GFO62908.1 MFS transporter [Geomonas paludis]
MFNSSFTLMRDHNYRIFSAGQGISWLGSVMQSVAQGWLVWSLTKSPTQLALAAIMVSLPVLLFSVPGGVAADRFDKRALLVITQGGSMIPPLFLGILALRGEATTPAIMFLASCQGVLNAFELPARQALLAELVPRDRLGQAVAVNAVSFNATRLFGPAAAGCIIAAFGVAPCFFLNAASYLVGMASLILVRLGREADHPLRSQVLPASELREGLCFVLGKKDVRQLLLSVLLVSIFAIPFVPLLPVFAELFQSGPRGLGFMSACLGSGSLLAALALACLDHLPHPDSDGAGWGVLFALALLLFSRSTDYPLALAALAVAGAALVVFLARANRSLQRACPDRLRGRVMGVYTLFLLGMAPVGNALMGGIAARLGACSALTLTSALCVAGLSLLQLRSRRRAAVFVTCDTLWSGTLSGNEGDDAGKGPIHHTL